ncbi:hypothetical protein BGZ98_006282, partial [Dissophora globulifera]
MTVVFATGGQYVEALYLTSTLGSSFEPRFQLILSAKLSCGITSAGPSPGSPSLLPEDNGDTFGSPVGGAVGDLNFSPTAAATRLSRPTGAECDCPAPPTGVLGPADAVAAAAAARLSGPVTGAGGDGDPTPAPTTEMPSPAGAVAGGDGDGPA